MYEGTLGFWCRRGRWVEVAFLESVNAFVKIVGLFDSKILQRQANRYVRRNAVKLLTLRAETEDVPMRASACFDDDRRRRHTTQKAVQAQRVLDEGDDK